MPNYQAAAIETKWQKKWMKEGIYIVPENPSGKPKYYILDMFPYPSGAGLHVGHPKGYFATDIFARLKMLQGFNVLHPMGWDAFGLPAENYALKNKIHPQVSTAQNVVTFKKQLEILGLTYDWNREINTTDPQYYKWTQWVFTKMFEKGLAYESNEPINWCPSCKTSLANEDLENGLCERCGSVVEKKPLRQWVLKITAYADRLVNDLDKLPHWETAIKEMERNWIGRSEGCEIHFKLVGSPEIIKVFTTRVDTIFGCTYVVLAPENQLVENLRPQIKNWSAVSKYIQSVKNKSDLERTDLNKEKSGILLEGIRAVNPFNDEEVAIYIADYVLNSYGTGAVMAVPAHDERDFEFAKKHGIEIRRSIKAAFDFRGDSSVVTPSNVEGEEWGKIALGELPYTEDGVLVDSREFTGQKSAAARAKMAKWLVKKGLGKATINYKIKDWVFSRQRYWGEPIPIIHCQKCGAVAVPEKDLPVLLPEVADYEPSGTGESPLAKMDFWINTKCPKCGGPGKRESNTMPSWAGSSWYYLRYMDPHNKKALVDPAREKYWAPVDFYVGGAEHVTRHMIYARFWHKFLYDIGVVSTEEPFERFTHVGLVMGEDGRKMSKRWGNVINPDDVVKQYGADALRVYEMFMGPFEQPCSWNTKALIGSRRFLDKVYNCVEKVATKPIAVEPDAKVLKKALFVLNKTIKKVGADIEEFRFNTAISQLMIFVNEVMEMYLGSRGPEIWKAFVQVISPFAPHLAEELWEKLGEKESVFKSSWPKFDPKYLIEDIIKVVVQVNGKLRGEIEIPPDTAEKEVLVLAKAEPKVAKFLEGGQLVKEIYVKGKLVSLVVK